MGHPTLATLLTMVAVVSLVPRPAAAQGQEPAADAWTAPLTPWGDPHLQGILDQTTGTPLERVDDYVEREFLSEEEAA